MKQILITAAVVTVAMIPATSSAGTPAEEDVSAGRGGQNLDITFTLRSIDGKPVKVKKFKFKNLRTTCDVGGPVDVKGRIGGSMGINDRGKFKGKVTDGDAKVLVKGAVKKGGTEVKGTIRAKGDFPPAEGCDSGKVRWEAS